MKSTLLAFAFFLHLSSYSQDYWSKVPPFPTECYSGKDDYQKKVSALKTELRNISEEKTAAIKKKAEAFTDEQKMKIAMQYQTMSPSDIVKMQNEQMEMLTLQQTVQEAGADVLNRYNEIADQYDKDRQAKLAPLTEEARKLPDGEGTPQWAIDKGAQLAAQYNKEYELLCQKYFTSQQALFKNWLVEYKEYLIEHDIPLSQKTMESQYRQFGITGDNDLPVIDAVSKYNDHCQDIFSKRELSPQ